MIERMHSENLLVELDFENYQIMMQASLIQRFKSYGMIILLEIKTMRFLIFGEL